MMVVWSLGFYGENKFFFGFLLEHKSPGMGSIFLLATHHGQFEGFFLPTLVGVFGSSAFQKSPNSITFRTEKNTYFLVTWP